MPCELVMDAMVEWFDNLTEELEGIEELWIRESLSCRPLD